MLKNYQWLVLKFLKKFQLKSAEWRDDCLWCFDSTGAECNMYQCTLHIQHELRKLEDTLRQRKIQPFAFDRVEGEIA